MGLGKTGDKKTKKHLWNDSGSKDKLSPRKIISRSYFAEHKSQMEWPGIDSEHSRLKSYE